jgi:hypothetical protein
MFSQDIIVFLGVQPNGRTLSDKMAELINLCTHLSMAVVCLHVLYYSVHVVLLGAKTVAGTGPPLVGWLWSCDMLGRAPGFIL